MSLKKWKRLSKLIVSSNKYWTYLFDKFDIGDGVERDYHYIHTNGSTMIIPRLSEDEFIMVKQFRYLNEKESIEFPCGLIEPGLSYEENALKELREETGYSSEKIESLGYFAPYTGVSDEICKVFLAQDLFNSKLKNDDTEEFEIIKISAEKIDQLISSNEIWDGLTLSAWTIFTKGKRQ